MRPQALELACGNVFATALREAVPRRDRQRHVNTEALREAVPRRDHAVLEKLALCERRYRGGTEAGPRRDHALLEKLVMLERRDRHPVWLIKL